MTVNPELDQPPSERQPLLPSRSQPVEVNVDGKVSVVDFNPNGDLENPLEWPASFKWSIVALLALMSFTVTFTCIGVVPVAHRIVSDLTNGGSDKSASILLVTIWELGEAAGPLFIAPLSELYGRYPVLNTSNAFFVAATVLSALSPTVGLFILGRVLTGLAVSTNVLSPAIIGDMFASEQRGSAMSVIMLAPLIGGAVGPAISGALAQTIGWRQVLLIAAAMAAGCEVVFLFYFNETYKLAILRRRAERLRVEMAQADGAGADLDEPSLGHDWSKLRASILRPAAIFFDSGVLIMMSLFGSLAFAYFYVVAVTLPDILRDIYGFSPALSGSAFMSFTVGSVCAVFICNVLLDKIYVKLRDANHGVGRPEFRLPLVIVGAFTMPLSVTAYGWTAELKLPVPVLLFTVVLIGFTLLLAFLPVLAYVVDAFGLVAASATTGVIVVRCLAGTFLPLTTAPLVASFGYGWGFTVLGGFCLVLAPIPLLLLRYGHCWRQRSQYTRDA